MKDIGRLDGRYERLGGRWLGEVVVDGDFQLCHAGTVAADDFCDVHKLVIRMTVFSMNSIPSLQSVFFASMTPRTEFGRAGAFVEQAAKA